MVWAWRLRRLRLCPPCPSSCTREGWTTWTRPLPALPPPPRPPAVPSRPFFVCVVVVVVEEKNKRKGVRSKRKRVSLRATASESAGGGTDFENLSFPFGVNDKLVDRVGSDVADRAEDRRGDVERTGLAQAEGQGEDQDHRSRGDHPRESWRTSSRASPPPDSILSASRTQSGLPRSTIFGLHRDRGARARSRLVFLLRPLCLPPRPARFNLWILGPTKAQSPRLDLALQIYFQKIGEDEENVVWSASQSCSFKMERWRTSYCIMTCSARLLTKESTSSSLSSSCWSIHVTMCRWPLRIASAMHLALLQVQGGS